MERLWLREVRRAAWRANAPFARQVVLSCGAAAGGTMVASLLPLLWDGPVAKAVWARTVGLSWIPRHLNRTLHRSPVELSIERISGPTGSRDTMTPIRAVLFS